MENKNTRFWLPPMSTRGVLSLILGILLPACNPPAGSLSGQLAIRGQSLPPTAPGAFTQSSPASGSTGIAVTPTFSWTASSSATSYTLQVSTSPTFTSPLVNEPGIGGTSLTPSVVLNFSTPYYWRVTATNAVGSTSAVGAPLSFTTGPPPTISLSTQSLSFSASASGANPAAQSILVSDSQPSSLLNWTVSADQPWLQFAPGFGSVSTGSNPLSVAPIVNQAEAWGATTTLTNAPNGQEDGSVVWTGKRMIVWGGTGPIGVMVNTGAFYEPASDTWTGTTSTVNAPSPRWGHRAVWTGTEMILWGGAPGGSPPLADGYRYDPVLDQWSPPISTVGAPSARRDHVAVWTGTEMFVWGGLTASGATNTGARYNPATDTWSSVSSLGAPSARDYLSAVWTGTDIIVFGGSDNTGLHYDPATDSWGTPLSTVGAPSRNNPCVVWTGSDMIVWSGYDGTTQPNTGARYTLATDSWTAMTTVNAPVGRRSGVAVWTGIEMIIWGGYDGSGYNNIGQRYQPPIALNPGIFTGTLTISDPNATNSPQTVTVTLTVTP